MVDDLLHQRRVILDGIPLHIGTVLTHHIPNHRRVVQIGYAFDLRRIAGGNFVDVIRMHLAALDRLAHQGIHNGHLGFDLVQGAEESPVVGVAPHLMADVDGGIHVAAADSVDQLVFGGVALLQHGLRQLLLKAGFLKIAGIQRKIQRQKFTFFHNAVFVGRHHQPHNGADGRNKAVILYHAHAAVIILYDLAGLFADMLADPFAGFVCAGAIGPRSHQKYGLRLVRDAEQRILQLKHILGDGQHVFGSALHQQLAELLPFKLGVKGFAQAVVKILQPGKGGGDPQAFDIVTGCQLF